MAGDKKYIKARSLWIYAFGIFGMQLFVGYINTYQSQFYTTVFNANLMIIAAIILIAKILSALVDPFIGNLIDRSNFKSGKMKPFILMSALPLAVLTTIMFVKINFASSSAMYIYITVTTILWNISMSFADIPSQGMLALLSPDSEERNVAAGITNVLKSIALAAPGLIVPVVCALTKSSVITEKEFLITALFIGVVGLTFYVMIYFFSEELVVSSKNKMTLKEMVKELKSNKMLLIIFFTFMLGFGRNMAMGISVQASAVLIKEGVDITIGSLHYQAAGENLPWLVGITAAISSMLSILVVPAINKKWGEKKTFIVFGFYGLFISTVVMLFYGLGGQAFRSLWAILIYQFFVGLMFGPHGYLPMVMVSDIVDYREWQTGKRTEGTQFAVLSLSIKVSNALSVAVGIFIVGASGYFGGIAIQAISVKMQNIVFAAFLFIPGLCSFLAALPVFFYKIDKKVKEQMRAEIAERRGN